MRYHFGGDFYSPDESTGRIPSVRYPDEYVGHRPVRWRCSRTDCKSGKLFSSKNTLARLLLIATLILATIDLDRIKSISDRDVVEVKCPFDNKKKNTLIIIRLHCKIVVDAKSDERIIVF